MKTKIESIQASLDKVDVGVARVLAGEFPESGKFILGVLSKRQKVLEKSMKKIRRFNRDMLVEWKA